VYPAEEDEIFRQGYAMTLGSLLVAPRAVEPPGEAKTQYEICSGLAERLGIGDQYTEGRTQKAWMEYLYHESRKLKPELPEDIDEAISHGIYKWYATSPLVALKAFRNNPRENPLSTPSGKIELFSRRLLDMGQSWELPDGDAITALPQYAHSWEGVHDPLRAQFPLQLIGHHFKGRVHSSFAGLAWLQKVAPQSLWINQLDAAKRGIRHGDMVKVFNGRGLTYVPAKVTLRIMPGVVSLPEGAWHKTNAEGEDIGGCVNVLTKDHSSPLAKGNPQHTNLVQVVKV
jgi:anaerobic selenocysteine-containing dehydrogenase